MWSSCARCAPYSYRLRPTTSFAFRFSVVSIVKINLFELIFIHFIGRTKMFAFFSIGIDFSIPFQSGWQTMHMSTSERTGCKTFTDELVHAREEEQKRKKKWSNIVIDTSTRQSRQQQPASTVDGEFLRCRRLGHRHHSNKENN